MGEFSWSYHSDWTSAQRRQRVVTNDLGARVSDEVWLGFDPSDPPYDTLASYWPLDETSGSTATDVVGANDGSINGATVGQTGILSSNAYDFNGSPDRVETSYTPPSDGAASMSFWVNFDSTSGDQLCGLNDANYSDPRFYLGLWSGDVAGGLGSNYGSYSTSLSTGRWYHFVLTGDGSTARMYLDGTEVASFSYHFDDADIGYYIGARNYPSGPSRYVDGQISDVMVWDRGLSASEVQTIYDTISSGSLTTDTRQEDGKADEVSTSATIPTSTSASLTLYQDTTGSGSANNQETVSIADGYNTVSLSSFESAIGGDYWATIDADTSETTRSPQIDSVTVSASDVTASDSGSITYSSADPIPASGVVEQTANDSGSITASAMRPLTAGPIEHDPGSITQSEITPRSVTTHARTGATYVITDYVTEGEPVDEALASLDADGRIIEFPPGTYQLGEFHSKSDELVLRAPRGAVTLEIIGDGPTALNLSGDAWRVEGFEFDFRQRASSQEPKQLRAAGSGWAIVDCVWRGTMAWESAHPAQAIAAQVDYPNGQGRIRGCYFPDGSLDYGRGVRVLAENIGTVQLQRCWFEDWAEPAIDTREAYGGLSISECYVRNTSGGIRINGPAQVLASTFVCDGAVPQAAQSGHDTMEVWLAGDRRTDEDTVYVEECDFCWFAEAGTAAGHPVDDRAGIDHLQMFACRLHNETTRATIAIGGGAVDIYQVETSGMAKPIKRTGGRVGTEQMRSANGIGADPTPPIPEPPALGETPESPPTGDVRLGRPGGSTEHFYGR